MTRYTPEDGQKFMAEEERRNAEETAAYFAWKRGESPLGQNPIYTPPEPDQQTPIPASVSSDNIEQNGSEEEGPMKHLFDDPLFEDTSPLQQRISIDEVDLDDSSPEGRERKMRAMADELAGFSAGQRKQALQREEERAREGVREGRKVMDHFGQRFEETPTRKK